MTWDFYNSDGTRKVQAEAGLVGDADTLDGHDASDFVLKGGDTMTGVLTLSGDPTNNNEAATKIYVDDSISDALTGVSGFVATTGDTMTGSLIMSGAGVQITLPNAPSASTDAVNKDYLDTNFLNLAGGTLTGDLNAPIINTTAVVWPGISLAAVTDGTGTMLTAEGGRILVREDPVGADDLTRKSYVDALFAAASMPPGLSELDEVSIVSPVLGEILTYDGSAWGNFAPTVAPDTVLTVSTTPFIADIDNTTLLVDTSALAINVVLPAPGDAPVGTRFTVKDLSGDALVNNITVDATGGELIDGSASTTINIPYGHVTVVYTGSSWASVG